MTIDLHPTAGKGCRVSIRSTRPLEAARIFEGMTPQTVLVQLPLLFSVCGMAQASAAVKAFRQAGSLAVTVPVDTAHAMLVHMETAREHLWRILVDWPVFIDESPDRHALASIRNLLPGLRTALFADGNAFALDAVLAVAHGALQEQIDRLGMLLARLVFGHSPEQWLELRDKEELADWSRCTESVAARLLLKVSGAGWQGLGAVANGYLPELPEDRLNRLLDAPDAAHFIAAPRWEGRTCETTPLSRQRDHGLIRSLQNEFGNGLLTRLVARLVELAHIPGTLRRLLQQLDAARPATVRSTLSDGIGIGQVEAARGRLVHRVVLADGKVRRYQILAPTEWNFHPAGMVARGLASLGDADAALMRSQADLLINSIDPCVGYDLRMH